MKDGSAYVRIRFIEAMLQTYGRVNRKVICNVFGVAEPTATRDLASYRELNSTIIFDGPNKQWVAGDNFKPSPDVLHMPALELIELLQKLYGVKIQMVVTKVRLGAEKP
ncbi:hypothetical protein AB6880_01805 [Rahnella inusitata]|uniref:hypothetical protein n=1 Tax=Rahnella inusitata TaxID=58169 RepID=UPI0039BEA4F7